MSNVGTKVQWCALSALLLCVVVGGVYAQSTVNSDTVGVNVDGDDIVIVSDNAVEVDGLVDPINDTDVVVTTTPEDSSDDTVVGVEPINQLPENRAAMADDDNNFNDQSEGSVGSINSDEMDDNDSVISQSAGVVTSISTNTQFNDDDTDNDDNMIVTTSVTTLPNTGVSREALGL